VGLAGVEQQQRGPEQGLRALDLLLVHHQRAPIRQRVLDLRRRRLS
jgi:hypothetical protein